MDFLGGQAKIWGAMASRWQRFAKKRPSQNEELILPPNYDEDQIKKDLHGMKS